MSESIEQLQTKLAETKNAIEKIDLLIAICWQTYRDDPTAGLKLARQAVRLASLKKEKDRMAEGMMLDGLCKLYRGEYREAIERLERASSLTDHTGNLRLTARVLHALGLVHTETGEYIRAFDCLARALDIAEHEQMKDRLPALHNSLGVAYSNIGDYLQALRHFDLVEKLSEELDDRRLIIWARGNIGIIYIKLGDYAKADEQYRRREELVKQGAGDKRDEIGACMARGEIFEGLGNYDEALRRFADGIALSRDINDLSRQAALLGKIGNVHLRQGRFCDARDAYQQAWDILNELQHGARWSLLLALAHAEFGLKHYDQAQEHALQALEEELKQQVRVNEHFAHDLLSQIYEELGDTANALKHHKLYTHAKEEIVGAEQQKQMAKMEMRAEVERAEKERELMRLEKQQIEAEMEHKQKELTAMALHLVEKNQFLDSLKREMTDVAQSVDASARSAVKGLMRQVDGNINSEDDWKAFEEQFEQVHHDFIKSLLQRYPKLTRTELKVCALLKLQLSTKEIANILATSTKNIEMQRYRIRKRLGLSSEQSFTTVFAEISM